MEVSGHILANCPPDHLIAVLYDVKTLERLMPMGATLNQTAKGRFAFSVRRVVGPITLTLPGQLSLDAKGTGHDQTLTLRAAHIIGGKVDLDLDLAITSEGGNTRLAYTGAWNAMGLSGRVLRDHGARVNAAIRVAMVQLKTQAEAHLRDGSATP